MKNLKIFKPAIAILASASILLLSGCTSSKKEPCGHFTIYFKEGPVTFKECEGYHIDIYSRIFSSRIDYEITKDGEDFLSGFTTEYTRNYVDHDIVDEVLSNESIQKSK